MNGREHPVVGNTLTFDDDDLTVDNSNCEGAVFHHLCFCGGITRDVQRRKLSKENTLGEQNPPSAARSWLIAKG